eukprot:SAG11_NODE_1266_length_5342_cov_4.156369_6_plen_158_part_00
MLAINILNLVQTVTQPTDALALSLFVFSALLRAKMSNLLLSPRGSITLRVSTMLLSGWALHIDAQVFGGSPFDSASSCDIAQLDSRIVRLDSVCCVGDRCTETCDVDCMEVIVPLLDDCGSEIDLVYDSMDGIRDGQARPLADAYNRDTISIFQFLI